ncbi:MAG: CehA/McbA family metallohydrolase [Candidatus Altiarchaeota archaeon]|nr:CehA/McbA family metallohydrolase [Candidatus Altiarchaeota archaeon]
MRLDIHVHSCFSDGVPTPKEIVEHCRKIGLDGVAITDHDRIEGSLEALKYAGEGFMVITGVEVSSKDGHILALGVKEPVEAGLSAGETVKRIHALGGIAIAAHPYDRYRRGVGDAVLTVPFDAIEAVNGHTFGNTKDPMEMAAKSKLPMTGGTDAHSLAEIGNVSITTEKTDILDAIKKGDVRIRHVWPGLFPFWHARTLLDRFIAGARKKL